MGAPTSFIKTLNVMTVSITVSALEIMDFIGTTKSKCPERRPTRNPPAGWVPDLPETKGKCSSNHHAVYARSIDVLDMT